MYFPYLLNICDYKKIIKICIYMFNSKTSVAKNIINQSQRFLNRIMTTA